MLNLFGYGYRLVLCYGYRLVFDYLYQKRVTSVPGLWVYLVTHVCTANGANIVEHPMAAMKGAQGTSRCHGTLVENYCPRQMLSASFCLVQDRKGTGGFRLPFYPLNS